MLCKILIIEDDRKLVESLTMVFNCSWPGSDVISTGEGIEGINLAKTENPDAILLDLGLPDISGFEVLKQIRLFSRVPVIILSARSSEDNLVAAMDGDASDYIIKPFRNRELLACVEAHINRWKTENELTQPRP